MKHSAVTFSVKLSVTPSLMTSKRLAVFLCAFMAMLDVAHARLVEGDGTGREDNRGLRKPASVASQATGPTAPQVSEKEVLEKTQQLPAYKTTEIRQKVQESVTKDLEIVRSNSATNISQAGSAADSSLKKTASGVAIFDLVEKVATAAKGGKKYLDTRPVTQIPSLNIGVEPRVSRSNWQIQSLDMKLNDFQTPQALATPNVLTENEFKTFLVPDPEKVIDANDLKVSAFGPEGRVSFETVRKIVMQINSETPVVLRETKFLSVDEIKMLKAEILLENKKCHQAVGFLTDLGKSEVSSIKTDANFHLALCFHQMGLFTESIRRMREVIRTAQPAELKQALKILTADLPKEFEEEIAEELKQIKDISLVPEESRDAFHYIIAKVSARSEHFNLAFEHADKVSRNYSKYFEAQYIMAIAEYSLEKKTQSLERQRKLKDLIDQTNGDKNLRSLIALNMGRIAFQEKRHKEALEYYSQIKKDHPLWVEALIEQGWTQLLMGDPTSAIGNMYSIHSPYFKSVYQPESFVVRTIGYLNICQYGDAYRTLSQLEQMHRTWLDQIQMYRKHASTIKYYELLVKYLKSSNTAQNLEGLPYQVLREMGRHKDYLNIQEAINARIDEADQYGFINGLINKDQTQVKWLIKKSRERLGAINAKLKRTERDTALTSVVNQWKREKNFEEDMLDSLNFESQVYDESHLLFGKFQKGATERLAARKSQLQLAAGEVLKDRLKKIETRLVSILDNNELLRYEVFAGSGENLRFQAAGGAEAAAAGSNGKRVSRNVKPESKALQWSFDGEFWEDEIGNYKSSLKDNCPERRAASGG